MGKSILIVDDSPAVRKIIRAFIELHTPYAICGEAGDGAEAIEIARILRPDLILMDLAMPHMNGVEASSVLKAMLPNVAIVLFTMYNESLGKSLATAAGIDAVVSKPDGIHNLVECVRKLLEPEAAAPATAAQ